MFARLFLLVTCFISLTAYSQNRYIDSLTNSIQAAREDTTKIILLNELVLLLRDQDPNGALEKALLAKALSEKLKFRKGLGNTLQNIGWIYYRKGDFVLALENSIQALSINKEFNDLTSVANCLNNLGAIQYEQKKHRSAVSYFKQGYELSKKIANSSIMSRSLNNISFCYIALKKLDSAEFYVKIAIDEGEKADDKLKTGFSDRILGDIYFEKKQWKKALESYRECLASARERDQNSLIVSTLHRIGRTYLKLNKPDDALVYLLENAETTKKLGYKDELEKTYGLLTEAYARKNDLATAFKFQTLFIEIHDSLFNEQSAQQIAQMEGKYEAEIKEARIALLTKDKELQEKEINTQKIIIYSFFLGLTLLAGLAFTLYSSNQKVKKANLELAERNEEIKTQAEQLGQLNTTKDKLFSIIGHDLRSPIAGLRGLMNLVSGGNLSQEEFKTVSKNVRQNLDLLHEDLDNLLSWARSQLGGLAPSPEYVSLHEVITDKINLMEPVAKAKGLVLETGHVEKLEAFIDPNHLNIILRNLISNAIKFSHAGGKIIVSNCLQGSTVALSVRDFGVGMSKEDLAKLFSPTDHFTKMGTQKERGMGLGLMLVKEFVDKNNSIIRVASEEGKGSTFSIEMPGR